VAVVFSVFATVAVVLSIVQAGFSLYRWIREPTFEVLSAYFPIEKKGEAWWGVKGGVLTIAAFGGARTRKIVDWRFMLFRWAEDGSGAGAGINALVEPILETIPAHEATKFTLRTQAGQAFRELPERLTGELHLRVDKYWTCIEFGLRRVGGSFDLDSSIEDEVPWSWTRRRLPWRKRVVSRIQRLF